MLLHLQEAIMLIKEGLQYETIIKYVIINIIKNSTEKEDVFTENKEDGATANNEINFILILNS